MKRVMMAMIRFYQKHISNKKPYPTCRFTPSCSAYAYEAFQRRGFFAGFALMMWRIFRCSPMSPCGYDPVPKKGFKTMPLRYSKYDPDVYQKELAKRLEAEAKEEAEEQAKAASDAEEKRSEN